MQLKRYERQKDFFDTEILKADEYTYSVLIRIVNGECRLVVTDHERLVICSSEACFPVWIWLPDDASEEELERAYQTFRKEFSFDEIQGICVKYSIADYFIKRAKDEGIDVIIATNMLAYNCPKLIELEKKADGGCYLVSEDDIEEVAEFIYEFHKEIAIQEAKITKEDARNKAIFMMENKSLYAWKNKKGENVAICSKGTYGECGNIASVYTKKSERRKGFAENIVHYVTSLIVKEGKKPRLYTDADYEASNACYVKIGYVKQGELCTIAKKRGYDRSR